MDMQDVLEALEYPLHMSVLYRDTEAVIQNLAEHGASINTRYKGFTPLMLAVRQKQEFIPDAPPQWGEEEYPADIIACLLEHGACVHDVDHTGATPLHMAADVATCTSIKLLLRSGANVNATNGHQSTALHRAASGYQHRMGDEDRAECVNVVKLLLQSDADPFAVNDFSKSPIEETVTSHAESLEVLKEFILNGVDIIDSRLVSDTGTNLLHRLVMTAMLNKYESISFLVKHGFSVNEGNAREETALHLAALYAPDTGVVETLCELGANAALVNNLKRSPLHYLQVRRKSTRKLYMHAVDSMISNGADVNAQDVFGCTPLHYALVFQNYSEHIDHLLENGARFNIPDMHGTTSLHYGAVYQRELALQAFTEKCSKDDLNQTDVHGSSVLHYAVSTNSPDIISLLVGAGVDTTIKDSDGYTALGLAREYGFEELVYLLDHHGAKANCNIEKGPDAKASTFVSPLPIPTKKYFLDATAIENNEFSGLEKPKDLKQFCKSILHSLVLGICTHNEADKVKREVEGFIHTVSQLCQEKEPMLRFTPKIRGSVSENTKCGPPDEFDVMLILDGFRHLCEMEVGPDKEYARLIYNGKDNNLMQKKLPYIFKQKFVDCGIVGLKLFGIIKDVLSKGSTWANTKLQFTKIEVKNVTINLDLRWTGVYFKALNISIDLVPCLPISNYYPQHLDTLLPTKVDFSKCSVYALLAHCASDNMAYRETFRYELSFTEFEEAVMHSLPEEARKGYRLAKALRSPFISHIVENVDDFGTQAFGGQDEGKDTDHFASLGSESFTERLKAIQSAKKMLRPQCAEQHISSYFLKNALLWEVKKAMSTEKCMREINTISYLEWTKKIFANLHISLAKDNSVPAFFKDDNLVDGSRSAAGEKSNFDEWKSALMCRQQEVESKRFNEAKMKGYEMDSERKKIYVDISTRYLKIFVKVINHLIHNDVSI